MKPFECVGSWFFPERPDEKYPGTLKFDPINGAVLTVLANAFLYFQEAEIILGITKDEHFTLWKCEHGGFSTRDAGLTEQKIHAQFVFEGCHFESYEDITFRKIFLRYEFFDEWVGLKLIQVTPFQDGETTGERIEYIDFHSKTINFLDYELAWLSRRSIRSSSSTVDLTRTTFLETEVSQPKHFDAFRSEILGNMEDFFCFVFGTVALPTHLSGETTLEIRRGEKTILKDKEIKIFHRSLAFKISEPKSDFLFKLSDVTSDLQQIIEKWMSLKSDLKPVIDMYVALFHMPVRYLETFLLHIAQLLEAYHRRVHGGHYMAPEEYEGIAKALTEAIPREVANDHRKSLKTRIAYGYEYSLRRRIYLICTEVLKDYTPVISRLIDDPRGFATTASTTRNYYTHYGDADGAITDPQALRRLVEQLRILFELCLAHELGFSLELVERLSSRSTRLKLL